MVSKHSKHTANHNTTKQDWVLCAKRLTQVDFAHQSLSVGCKLQLLLLLLTAV
jgi:hypothetical protein